MFSDVQPNNGIYSMFISFSLPLTHILQVKEARQKEEYKEYIVKQKNIYKNKQTRDEGRCEKRERT